MKNPFEKLFTRRKDTPEEPEPASPSFKELVMSLPDKDEQDELRRLENVPEEIATGRNENGLEIDHDMISEEAERTYERYHVLLKKATDLFEQKKIKE